MIGRRATYKFIYGLNFLRLVKLNQGDIIQLDSRVTSYKKLPILFNNKIIIMIIKEKMNKYYLINDIHKDQNQLRSELTKRFLLI